MELLAESADKTKSGPFYQTPKTNPFKILAIAEQPVTDKVTAHTYEFMYDKYLGMRRMQRLKLLEIGLGCDMIYDQGRVPRFGENIYHTRRPPKPADPCFIYRAFPQGA